MKADELHTVYIPKHKLCVWLIEEFPPTGEYNGMTYSTKDLTSWTSKDLYIEVDNTIKNQYIEKYSSILKLIIK